MVFFSEETAATATCSLSDRHHCLIKSMNLDQSDVSRDGGPQKGSQLGLMGLSQATLVQEVAFALGHHPELFPDIPLTTDELHEDDRTAWLGISYVGPGQL